MSDVDAIDYMYRTGDTGIFRRQDRLAQTYKKGNKRKDIDHA